MALDSPIYQTAGACAEPRSPPETVPFDTLTGWTRKVAEILKATAHQDRFLSLGVLANGEKSVSELQNAVALPQAVVSSHLARLRLNNLVKTRRDGRAVYYSLAAPEILALICACNAFRSTTSPLDRLNIELVPQADRFLESRETGGGSSVAARYAAPSSVFACEPPLAHTE